MHKKFEVNRTKIKRDCQSHTKTAPWESQNDLTLIFFRFTSNFLCTCSDSGYCWCKSNKVKRGTKAAHQYFQSDLFLVEKQLGTHTGCFTDKRGPLPSSCFEFCGEIHWMHGSFPSKKKVVAFALLFSMAWHYSKLACLLGAAASSTVISSISGKWRNQNGIYYVHRSFQEKYGVIICIQSHKI